MIIIIERLLLVTLLLIAGQGCAARISLDPSPPAAAANYPTAEFRAQGKLFHGLGEIALKKGEPLSSVALQVQGYFGGTIRVDSGFCHIRKSVNYTGMELVSLPLPGKATDSCVIDIVVTSIYPTSYDQNTLVYEMKGQLLVKVLPDQRPYFLASSKVAEGSDTNIFVPVESMGGSVQAVFKGCGYEFIDSVPVNDGEAMISARSVGGPQRLDRCVHEGFVDMLSSVKRVSWNIWSYAKGFSPLSLPRIHFAAGTLNVEADPAVSVIILDDRVWFSPKATFKVDPDVEHTLRLLTVKGRSVLCQWSPSRAEWTCRQ